MDIWRDQWVDRRMHRWVGRYVIGQMVDEWVGR